MKQVGMPPIEIKVELLRVGVTMQSIADECGVSRPAVSMTIHRTMGGWGVIMRNPDVRRCIAKKINRTYDEVWGEPDPRPKKLEA